MKILHVNCEKAWRGGERQTLLLAQSLSERGVANLIACRSGSPLLQSARGAAIATVALRADAIRGAVAIASAARSCDLIHCHTGRAHSLAAGLSFWHRKPIIATRRVAFAPKRSWLGRRKYAGAAKVVCVSAAIADQLRRWGVRSEQLAVIADGVPLPDGADSSERAARLRARLGISADRKVVGTIGALVPEKDQATFLRAAAQVVKARSDVTFVVVGDGAMRDELLAQRDALGLQRNVSFTGFIAHADGVLGAFDVFVLSSRSEGLGSSILDAFAADVPVIATAVGGIPELVEHGETGLLVTAGDASAMAASILGLLEDRAWARRLAAAARLRVEREYSIGRMTERYLSLYREVLARSPRGSTRR